MTFAPRPMIVSGILSCTLWLPAAAFAQDQGPAVPAVPVSDVSPQAAGRAAPSALFDAVAGARADAFAWPQARPRRGGVNPVAIGAFIGAAAAVVATAAAARSYGENESGQFCSACMVQWSTFTVPIGAGAGAAIGYGVKLARRSVTAVPLFSRKAAAVVVTARF
jgi:hypothetical protein